VGLRTPCQKTSAGEADRLLGQCTEVATLLVTRAELLRFADVPDEFAIAEGEGDFTGDEFRAGYLPGWIAMGYEVTDDCAECKRVGGLCHLRDNGHIEEQCLWVANRHGE